MPIPRYQFFNAKDAAVAGSLQFTARKLVEGLIVGQHKSPHRGFSVEFAEYRDYTPGDELRHLDWRTLARSDRYYVKLYEQETNLRTTLLIDTSNSMQFAGKIDYARHLAACLAYLLSTQQDLAGLVAVDESVRAELPPGSSPAHLDRLFKALEGLQPGGTIDLAAQLHVLSQRLPRRSMVVLISDLWTDPDALQRALQHLRYRKHQALVIHLLDRAETELTYDKQVTLEDLETGERLQIDPSDLRETYIRQVATHIQNMRRICNNSDVEYHDMYVDQPYDKALVRLLNRRK
jgi:uncharacterized protein (DUF58 family)